jgi:hypothetical protein
MGLSDFTRRTGEDRVEKAFSGRCCPDLARPLPLQGRTEVTTMGFDTSEHLPSALAIAILGETAMEHLHQVAQRIRENIDELLAEEERRQHMAGEDCPA